MASIQELIGKVSSIKLTSEQLSGMLAAANVELSNQSTVITNLVRGSNTGQEAVMALSTAARSLSEVAAAMRTLARNCDEYIANVSK